MSSKPKYNLHDKLPGHKAGPEAWEKISAELDKLEASANYHEALNSLPQHHAAPEIWHSVENSLSRKPLLTPVHFTLTVSIMLLFFLLIPLLRHDQSGNKLPEAPAALQIADPAPVDHQGEAALQNAITVPENISGEDPQGVIPQEDRTTPVERTSGDPVIQSFPTTTEEKTKTFPGLSDISLQSGKNEKFKGVENQPIAQASSSFVPLIPGCPFPVLPEASMRSKFYDLNILSGKKKKGNKYLCPDEGKLSAGLFAGTGMNHYPGKGNVSQDWHVGIDGRYIFTGYFLQTGLWVASAKDVWNYSVDYLKQDIVGNYTKVDSVIYHLDTLTYTYQREYVTSEIDVFDTVEGFYRQTLNSRSIYLEIPFLAGYRLKGKTFSYYFVLGPVMSFLVKKGEIAYFIPGTGLRVLQVENEPSARLNTNWQMYFGMGVSCRLDKHYSVFAEPEYRQYIKPVYKNSRNTSRKVCFTGLKAGIRYSF
ncbi:MAG: hypothetical protein JXA03_07365 [Bacteroidales bacterium]|nr:hypothetical protein [Bacteroidales bacterium]